MKSEGSIAELTATYNQLAARLNLRPVKKFSDRPTALKRVAELTARVQSLGRKRPLTDLPFTGQRHKIRPKSLRGRFVTALTEGTTQVALQKIADEYFAEKKKATPENIVPYTVRILHRYTGFGIREVDGRLFLVAEHKS